jgi:hypothetical protein
MYKRYPCPDPEIQAKIDALPKLDPKSKKLWVDALLSGEYEQGRENLKRTENGKDYFCCLGVAVNEAINHKKVEGKYNNKNFYINSSIEENALLPSDVVDWLTNWIGYRNYDDFIVYYDGNRCFLTELNDAYKLDFEMIAGLIINQL